MRLIDADALNTAAQRVLNGYEPKKREIVRGAIAEIYNTAFPHAVEININGEEMIINPTGECKEFFDNHKSNKTKNRGETELTDYERLLHTINGVQDFGVAGGMGDIVDNDKLAKALSEQGCIIVKTVPNMRRKRYTK